MRFQVPNHSLYLTAVLLACLCVTARRQATDPHSLNAHRLIEKRADDDTTFA